MEAALDGGTRFAPCRSISRWWPRPAWPWREATTRSSSRARPECALSRDARRGGRRPVLASKGSVTGTSLGAALLASPGTQPRLDLGRVVPPPQAEAMAQFRALERRSAAAM